MATIAGLILGPHCLNWFHPLSWGNSDTITLEISRIVLCIQIVAVAVELPRKYMKRHWLSVAIFLLPVMTCGWLVVGLFIWALIPHFDFPAALLVAACVTATDPVLAAAVVGKGKFAERVPGHLRNLLTAESGCNDGMAFPFIYLSLNLVIHHGHAGEIIKDWICLTLLWECVFGVVLGVVIGYVLRKAVAFAESKSLIDRESFLAIFIFIAFNSAGIGSILGVNDLLVSFAAGTAFGWNGYFAKKTEESHVSTVIDMVINLAFFVYFGAIIPWPAFNKPELGLSVWRLIVLAIVIIFLRRIPAVLALKPFTPDVKTWREALFCGHFGPIGVGAIFAAILARNHLEETYLGSDHPLQDNPDLSKSHFQLISLIWPIVCFIVITSIIVHGSSVAVLTLGKRLNRMAITMSFTTTNTQDQGPSWIQRLQKLDRTNTSFSLQRIDTTVPSSENDAPVDTSGVKVRPAGGARRKKQKRKSRLRRHSQSDLGYSPTSERQRPQAEVLQLGRTPSHEPGKVEGEDSGATSSATYSEKVEANRSEVAGDVSDHIKRRVATGFGKELHELNAESGDRIPTVVFQEGSNYIVEDQNGEVLEELPMKDLNEMGAQDEAQDEGVSIHSMGSLRRHLTQYSVMSDRLTASHTTEDSLGRKLLRTLSGTKKSFIKKGDGKRFFAHQVDDLLVVENADGEVVRRYRVNKHAKPEIRHKLRSNSLVGKALSLVGVKNKSSEDSKAKDQQAAANVIPESPSSDIEDPVSTIGEKPIISKLPQPINEPKDGHVGQASRRSKQPKRKDESAEEETEVEKRRRLAALGQISNDRDINDEEE